MNENNLVASVVLVKLVMLALAVVLTHLTYRSYRRSGRTEIRALSVGFAAIAIGILVAGALYLSGSELLVGLLVEAVFSSFGLGMIVYSLYGFE